ncbi:hypothetical protein DFQ28_004469 [Apophysomyces sp. BC1034]|nr:hypothetical protein DFQ30_002716 [Apophysomyces sp. BC1015]KAG0182878.1 hypothetical protein DFQ29_001577 [Apophysomyces sp. BC1021]KAG0193577.1 hypothetical protein DFQ28_004469 [Apophysomyces sp. BC1034]
MTEEKSRSNVSLRPLHLRILFPHLLTLPKTDPRRFSIPSDITTSKAIDLELYTYFALLVRDFIHPWYRLVTNDQDLCTEITEILITVVQRLQKRLCEEVDWTELILIKAPKLLTVHYRDYRTAKARLHMPHAGGAASLEELFHGMQPHFAMQPQPQQEQQQQQAEYLRLLADFILKTLLDPQDCKSNCLRHLVREILANLVLGSLVEVLSDPYTIHMVICKLLVAYEPLVDLLEASGDFTKIDLTSHDKEKSKSDLIQGRLQSELEEAQTTPLAEPTAPIKPSPDKKGLPMQLQRLQEKRREKGDEIVDAEPEDLETQKQERRRFSFGYITLQVILAPVRALWLYLNAVFTSSQERYQQVTQHKKRTQHMRLLEPIMQFARVALLVEDRPVLQWAWQMVAMFLWPLIRVLGGGILVDKFLEQTILHVLSEGFIVFYLQLGRDLLWPDGVLISRSESPTAIEREKLRIRAERLLAVSFPSKIRKVIFETNDMNELQSHMHDAIEPLQNKYINKHLMFILIDLVASTIIPELVEPNDDKDDWR